MNFIFHLYFHKSHFISWVKQKNQIKYIVKNVNYFEHINYMIKDVIYKSTKKIKFAWNYRWIFVIISSNTNNKLIFWDFLYTRLIRYIFRDWRIAKKKKKPLSFRCSVKLYQAFFYFVIYRNVNGFFIWWKQTSLFNIF